MHWSAIVEAAALTLVFVLGSVFDPLRKHGPAVTRFFASCPLCVGVWVGAGVVFLRHPAELGSPGWLTLLTHGAAAGVLALVVKLVVLWLDAR